MGKQEEYGPISYNNGSAGQGSTNSPLSPPNYRSISEESSRSGAFYGTSGPRSFSPEYKDKWATFLFIAHLVVVGLLSTAGYNRFANRVGSGDHDHFTAPATRKPTGNETPIPDLTAGQVVGILVSTFAVGLGLTVLYFVAMQKMAGKMIKFSFYLNIALVLALALLSLFSGNVVGAMFAGFYLIILFMMFTSWKARIPFATVMLETVTSVTKSFPATLASGVIALVAGAVWAFIWATAAMGVAFLFVDPTKQESKDQQVNAAGIAAGLYMFFSYVWTSMIINNTVHVTNCGLFATFYFQGVSSQGQVVVPVKNPTAASAKRALTSSFGSIAYGSLILAAVDTLRYAINLAKRHAHSENNDGLAIFLACLECIVSVIEGYIEFFNEYAFAQVAIYGKSYCQAAHDTWELIKTRGIDLIINDDLVSSVLGLGAFLVGLLSGAVSWFMFTVAVPNAGPVGYLVFALGLIFGITQFSILAQVIKSGVVTTFVCLAEDPEALKRTKPELFSQVQQTYQHIALFSMV